MKTLRWSFGLLMLLMLSACGDMSTLAPTIVPTADSIAPSGSWSLAYTGDCEAREGESLDITITEDDEIVFDDYTLTLDDDGNYIGSAQFTTPMPVDGRDVVFVITYNLTQEDRTTFIGTETVEEVGKGEDPCPIRLTYASESD